MSARRSGSTRTRGGRGRRQSTGSARIPRSAPTTPTGNHEPVPFPAVEAAAATAPTHTKRRSSLNLTTRLTAAEARALRRQREEAERERKAAEAEAKRQQIKARKQAMAQQREQESQQAVTCDFCTEVMPANQYAQHKVEHPSQIRQRLWLGKKKNVINRETMEFIGATHLLNCAKEVEIPPPVRRLLRGYHHLDLIDKSKHTIIPFMREALEFMDNSLVDEDAILAINCVQGISRSGSFTCAFLMWKEARSLHDAMAEIVSRRPIVLPNGAFLRQLQELEIAFREDRDRPPEERVYGTPLPYTIERL